VVVVVVVEVVVVDVVEVVVEGLVVDAIFSWTVTTVCCNPVVDVGARVDVVDSGIVVDGTVVDTCCVDVVGDSLVNASGGTIVQPVSSTFQANMKHVPPPFS
jgi:hypothetical protein